LFWAFSLSIGYHPLTKTHIYISKHNMASKMASLDAAFMGATTPGRVGLEALELAAGAQKVLNKSVNAILPLMLMLGGIGTIIHRFATSEGGAGDPIQAFLVMVTVQLLPMIALKFKTWICSERASLMPVALVKTLMMHVTVQVFRIALHVYAYTAWRPYNAGMEIASWQQCFDVVTLCVGLYILFKEFNFKFGSLISCEHDDVVTTIAGGCLMSIIVNFIAPVDGRSMKLVWVLNDFANYGEVLAFVPVARIICLDSGVEAQTPGKDVEECDRRKARVFMAFVLAFYFWDDLVFTPGNSEIPLVAAGKAAHFVMLLDFAAHFVLQVGAQPKIVDEVLPKILPKAILQEVVPQQDAEMGFQTSEQQGLLAEEDDEEAL